MFIYYMKILYFVIFTASENLSYALVFNLFLPLYWNSSRFDHQTFSFRIFYTIFLMIRWNEYFSNTNPNIRFKVLIIT